MTGALLDERQFNLIKDMLYQEAGITLAPHKRQMVQNRIARRLKDLPGETLESYLARMSSGNFADEILNLVNALTTNVTYFFREGHHFDHLAMQAVAKIKCGQRAVRIWSAGCSIGAEPYSAAIALYEACKKANMSGDIKILATDIDTIALKQAREGCYVKRNIKGLTPRQLDTHFKKELVAGSEDDAVYTVAPHIRRMVSYNHLNLNVPQWPMSKAFDFIFCRNVLIYFDRIKQQDYVRRMSEYMAPDGFLYLGHSEHAAISGLPLEAKGQTTYQKQAEAPL